MGTAVIGHPARVSVNVGDVVQVRAMDWGIMEQHNAFDGSPNIVWAYLYGQVIRNEPMFLSISPQIFDDGDARYTISVPWACIDNVLVVKGR